MKRTLISKRIRKVIGTVAVMAIGTAIIPTVGANAGVRVPRSEDTLVFPLPVSLSESFFVELGDQGTNTPTVTDGQVLLHYVMEGDSGDTVVEGAIGTYCDDRPNSPTEVLRVYKENAHGSLDADALLSGNTTNTTTGAQEPFEQRIPEEGSLHLAGGQNNGGTTPILRICR